jgi:cardiolipin synthase A/B
MHTQSIDALSATEHTQAASIAAMRPAHARVLRSRAGALGILVLGTLCALSACTTHDAADTEVEEDLTASDPKVLATCAEATRDLAVVVRDNAAKDLGDAMVAAKARGVRVRAILIRNAYHGTFWMFQQRLEGFGIPVEVQPTDRVVGVTLVADKTAFVGNAPTSVSAKVTAARAAFEVAWGDAPKPSAKPALLAPEQVALLPMPDSGTERLLSVVAASKQSIDLSIYQLAEENMISALIAAADRGVTVRVMLEPKTVGARNFETAAAALTAAKITVLPTPPNFDASRNVDHAKFMIIDGKELLFSTGNLAKSSVGGVSEPHYRLRDFWVEDTRAAMVGFAQEVFNADFARREPSAAAIAAFVLTPNNAESSIGALIDGAKKRLWVYNQTLDDAGMQTKILAAKKRGVDVRVLAGFQPGFGGPPPNDAAVKALLAAGIPAAFLKRHYLHAKAVLADDAVFIGSQNFSNGGLRNNRELGEILRDATVVKKMEATFLEDFEKHE